MITLGAILAADYAYSGAGKIVNLHWRGCHWMLQHMFSFESVNRAGVGGGYAFCSPTNILVYVRMCFVVELMSVDVVSE